MGGLRAFGAELMGTFALTLAGAGAVCMDAATGGRLGPVGIAFAYAAAMTAVFYMFPGSGARFNPALTFADLTVRRLTVPRGVFAVGAQLLGAACAGLFLKAVLSGGNPNFSSRRRFSARARPAASATARAR
jgi:glycerol uptake facilitator-like aquaporin